MHVVLDDEIYKVIIIFLGLIRPHLCAGKLYLTLNTHSFFSYYFKYNDTCIVSVSYILPNTRLLFNVIPCLLDTKD